MVGSYENKKTTWYQVFCRDFRETLGACLARKPLHGRRGAWRVGVKADDGQKGGERLAAA